MPCPCKKPTLIHGKINSVHAFMQFRLDSDPKVECKYLIAFINSKPVYLILIQK